MKKFVAAIVLILALVSGFLLTVATASAQSDEGALEGFVFLDEDGDGRFDLTEAGIEGVTVRLEGETEDEVETSSTGAYRFSDLPAGTYSVSVDMGDDYATTDRDRFDDLEPDGVEISSINFALQNADEAMAADDEDSDVAEDEAMDEEASDEDADADADEDTDADTDEDADADEDADMDADEDDAAMSDAAMSDAAMSDAAMSDAAMELIGSLSEDEVDPVVVAAFMAALESAEEEGTSNATTDAIRDALAEIDSETLAAAAAINAADDDVEDADEADEGDEADTDDEDEDVDSHEGDMDEDEDTIMMSDPDPSMPETGGGPLEMGLLAALALLVLAGAGRMMEGQKRA
jgi:hypothetical protein